MKYLKICGVLAIILIAVTFLGVVSAAEVTVGDQQFDIPDGFKENTSAAKEKITSQGTTYTKVFENDKGQVVIINVAVLTNVQDALPDNMKVGKIGDIKLTAESGEENKTINGVEGFFNPDTHQFKYAKGTSMIIIASTDDSSIEGFVKA